ncbi:MAG TPA: ABC transporter permease [Thermotogota bacterium]|nr:ABC transporter permease [Thermotogota bacterium]HPJ88779.1 ABC transporter permease [Thermotogota bacterium]HPR96282.1 ABC transporter permease [Thermotogota bacterium]
MIEENTLNDTLNPKRKFYQTRNFYRAIHNKRLIIGLFLVVFIVIVALFAPLIAPEGLFSMDFNARLAKPSGEHLLGCDDFGRDILSRIILGTRVSLTVGLVSQLVALLLGATLGMIAGYYGELVDNIIMRIMDVFFSFPSLLLAIALMTAFGSSMSNIILAIGIVYTPHFARIVRGSVLSVREKEYIESARAQGMSDVRLIIRHILPNIMGPIIIYATMGIGDAILTEAGLSFLGLGIQPPTPSWGGMLSNGKNFISVAPYEVIFAGIAIVFTVLAFNTFGDGIRDYLDPRQNQ